LYLNGARAPAVEHTFAELEQLVASLLVKVDRRAATR
jgi:hypothetical protein